MNYIKTFDPSILLGDRLGITLYCMLVRAYLLGDYSKEIKMYKKFINNFPREVDTHTPENFFKLIENIKNNGFDLSTPIYANPNEFTLLDGAHRSAIAIQLGIKDVPYSLRFQDDRTDDSVLHRVFGDKGFELLQQKRDEYISLCEPLIALKCRIRMHMRENSESFQAPFSSQTKIPSLRLYQSLEKLDIPGKRLSQRRVETYELARYLSNSMRVMEVGCNVGFLSLAIADYVHSIDAFDIDQNYITIAEYVQEFCNNNNCRFFVQSLSEFVPIYQYDFVISTAVHGWSALPFEEYVSILTKHIKPGGLLFFESHELDAEKNWPDKRALLTNNYDLIGQGFIDDVDDRMYQSEIREFLILRKRLGVDYGNLRLQNTRVACDNLSAEEKHPNLPATRQISQIARNLARLIFRSTNSSAARIVVQKVFRNSSRK